MWASSPGSVCADHTAGYRSAYWRNETVSGIRDGLSCQRWFLHQSKLRSYRKPLEKLYAANVMSWSTDRFYSTFMSDGVRYRILIEPVCVKVPFLGVKNTPASRGNASQIWLLPMQGMDWIPRQWLILYTWVMNRYDKSTVHEAKWCQYGRSFNISFNCTNLRRKYLIEFDKSNGSPTNIKTY